MDPLVGIFAHPDDEAFGPAGTIAKYAKNRDVYLICVTDGGSDIRFSGQDPKLLAPIRKKELIASSKILGVSKVFFLDYQDGGLCNNLYHQLAQDITKILDKIRPSDLLTYDKLGISGHIDHIAVSLVSTYVFDRQNYLKNLLYYCEPLKITEKIQDYFIYLPPGCDPKKVDLIEDVSDFWDIKVNAILAHHSQIKDARSILDMHKDTSRHLEHFMITTKK